MERERLLTIGVIFLLILNVTIVGFLFLRRPGPPPRHELFKVIVNELQLDEDQQKTFFYLRDQHHEMMEDLDKKFKEVFDRYLDLLREKKPSATLRDSLESQMGLFEKSKASITLQHFQKVKELCNTEQKKKFDLLIPEIARGIGRQKEQGPPQ
jgi:hypothetical protein